MLHVVEQPCPVQEDELLSRMFMARKQVFVDLLRWEIPALGGRYEVDHFDDEHAIYLIVADPDGAHLASARLLPTTRPHILADLYADLCDGEIPRGPDIYEVTRFCLDRHINAAARRDARNCLIRAIADFGLAQGIRRYTGVAEGPWLRQVLAFGWHSHLLGSLRRIDGRMLGALVIEIDPETPELLTRGGIIAGTPAPREMCHAA